MENQQTSSLNMSKTNGRVQGDKFTKTFDVFVGSLKPDKTEEWAREYFSKYGVIDSVSLRQGNKDDGTNILFVRYKDRMSGVRAIESNARTEWGRVGGASKSGVSWYEAYKSERGDKRAQEAHIKIAHKPDRIQGRQPNLTREKLDKGNDVIRKEEIMLSFHETPLIFWGQPIERSTELRDLSDQLQIVCPGGQCHEMTPSMDKIYATMYSSDGQWYRCQVSKIISESQVQVTFIDFGNSEVKSNVDIKELLANLAAIRPLAKRYCLYGLRALHPDKDSLGFSQGCEKLIALTDNKSLVAHVYPSNSRGLTPVMLESDTADINQEMLNHNFAETTKVKSPPPSQTGQMSMAQCPPQLMAACVANMSNNLKVGQWMPQLKEGVKPNGAHSNKSGGLSPVKHQKPPKLFPNQNDITNNNKPHHPMVPGPDPWLPGSPNMAIATAEIARLQNLAHKAQQEAHQMGLKLQEIQEAAMEDSMTLKRQWDATLIELEATKVNLKTLSEDCAQLRRERCERSLPQRLKRLVLSVEKVKNYRQQFPTDDQGEDLIEQAFNVATASTKITTGQLAVSKDVEKSQSIYRTTMNAIMAAENTEGLNDLIAARDQSRRDLALALTAFISTVSQFPLSDRSYQVENMLAILAETYPEFLKKDCNLLENINSFEEAIVKYRDWKCQKKTEFAEARTRTNTCHNGINSTLRSLQQQLSLDSIGEVSVSTIGSLDQLLDGLQDAVEEEANKTNLGSKVNESDSAIVATLLHVLDAELRLELADIVHLRSLLAENTSFFMNIKPWLTEKPNIEPILVIRKKIKSLKSRLRHRLADLEDLEEDCDLSDTDQLTDVKNELAKIREQLHTEFAAEDHQLAWLGDMNEGHFPELNMQNAELDLYTVKQYNGLVKRGRALDQFELEVMPGTNKRNIYKAIVCGKCYVLKEYIIDDTLGVKKNDFLRRIQFYHHITNLHILPLEAVFFTGAGRQAYVQMPYFEKNLTQLLNEGPLSMECAYHILCKVLIGLQAIHSANLICGAVHPNNILLTGDATQNVVVSELNFSKPPSQRAGIFITKSKLCFKPPEFHTEEISWASDMFNFGLLAIWLHFPSYKFTLRPNGVPDFSPLEMDRSLEQLLVSLLIDEPSSRRMASSTWLLPYFANSPHSRPNSPRQSPEDQTLQLRPRTDCKTNGRTGGILKNKGSASPSSSSSPILSPRIEQNYDVESPAILATTTEKCEATGVETRSPEKILGDVVAERFLNEESAGSTPVLLSSPQGTPMNTPVDRQSGCSTPPDGHAQDESHRLAATTGLVKTAMLQCASLETTHALHHEADEVTDLFDEIAARTKDLMGTNQETTQEPTS